MIEHRNLVNLIDWHCDSFKLRPGHRSSSVAAFGFDAAGWEIWPPLCVGAALVLPSPADMGDPEVLLAWWGSQDLDVSLFTLGGRSRTHRFTYWMRSASRCRWG
jgi:non-ribosomal peptide synthetase component F